MSFSKHIVEPYTRWSSKKVKANRKVCKCVGDVHVLNDANHSCPDSDAYLPASHFMQRLPRILSQTQTCPSCLFG